MTEATRRKPAICEAIDSLLDSRFGVIRLLVENPRQPGSPEFFHYHAEACNTVAFGVQPNFTAGGGASTERDAAMAKALGEAIERYCASLYLPENCPLTSYDGAPFPCVDPADFALYRADQCAAGDIEFVPFTKDLPVRWTPAIDVATAEVVYVPASMVFVPYYYALDEGELPVAQPISTGLACNEGYEAACVSAASEAIERDAFTIFWQAGIAPPTLRAGSLDAANADRIERFARARYEVTLFDITTDVLVPSVMAVARHDDESCPALVIAAAAHPVAATAIRKCLEELDHTRAFCRSIKNTISFSADMSDPRRIDTQTDHLRFWCEHSNRARADWLFASDAQRDVGELPGVSHADPLEQFAYVRRALQAADLRLLVADVTSPDIAELGLRVVRAVVPGLHPLVIGHRKRALGGRRLYEVPRRLGYATPVFRLDDDAHPHPFP